MLADGRGVADNATLDADLCIVGAGAAGIVLALELADTPLKVVVLESGGLEYEPETQDLYRGENVGHPYFKLESSRLRMFGGTTGHWQGWCRPLDPIDFEERSWVSESGWPIGRDDLDPFYERAQRYVQAGPFDYRTARWERATGAPAFTFSAELVDTDVFLYSPPTHFGTAYRARLRRARNVTVLLHSNVVSVGLASDARRVERVDVATLTGKRFTMRARRFVVAVGGIETPRLLLASTDVARAGVGNAHDLVGRYFADHPHAPVALASLPKARVRASLYVPRAHVRGTTVRGVLVTADRVMRAEANLRFSVSLDPVEDDPYVRDSDAERQAEELGRSIGAVEQGLWGGGERALFSLFMRAEQEPNRDSRVTLADEADPLGVPRARLDWRLSELDRASIGRSVRAVARALGGAALGHVYSRPDQELSEFWERVEGGFHHLGTARMHDDPRRGVVDRNCRVHGVENLYLAGSSVFPTTGYANPTLTLVALAARLARHLRTAAA